MGGTGSGSLPIAFPAKLKDCRSAHRPATSLSRLIILNPRNRISGISQRGTADGPIIRTHCERARDAHGATFKLNAIVGQGLFSVPRSVEITYDYKNMTLQSMISINHAYRTRRSGGGMEYGERARLCVRRSTDCRALLFIRVTSRHRYDR